MSIHYNIRIGWLYPELMSTYGDRGNILLLQRRCMLRGIDCTVVPIQFNTKPEELNSIDLFFGGGAQDRQQSLLIHDLRVNKGSTLKRKLDAGTPGLFVCGSPQLLGHSFIPADGKEMEGLHILDITTRYARVNGPRCIGNMVVDVGNAYRLSGHIYKSTIIGFENHGGRTYLGSRAKPFGKVLVGYGNNGEDQTEGVRYNNCIATYSHGPFLSKNPHIADWLLTKTLSYKYNKNIKLNVLDDTFEWQAHEAMLHRLGL